MPPADPARSAFADQPVLVTGASGFIGTHLCHRLASAGAIVHAAARHADATPGVAQVHTIDLADGPCVDRLIAGVAPSYVFHLAGHVSGSRDLAEVGPTFASNLTSTVHLLRNLTGTRCRRIVLAGSLEEIDSHDVDADAHGASATAPSSPYAAAKSAATMYARMFHALYGTPVTIARVFMVYGPGQRDVRKLVPYVATSCLAGRAPRLTSGVRPVDWVYVDDVVDALIACAILPGLDGQTVDVGTGQATSVRRVAERIARLVGRAEPVFGAIADRPLEQVRIADASQTERILGRPLTSLDDGLRRTVDWYREPAHRPAELESMPVTD